MRGKNIYADIFTLSFLLYMKTKLDTHNKFMIRCITKKIIIRRRTKQINEKGSE